MDPILSEVSPRECRICPRCAACERAAGRNRTGLGSRGAEGDRLASPLAFRQARVSRRRIAPPPRLQTHRNKTGRRSLKSESRWTNRSRDSTNSSRFHGGIEAVRRSATHCIVGFGVAYRRCRHNCPIPDRELVQLRLEVAEIRKVFVSRSSAAVGIQPVTGAVTVGLVRTLQP
jgi:hypothetical protein